MKSEWLVYHYGKFPFETHSSNPFSRWHLLIWKIGLFVERRTEFPMTSVEAKLFRYLYKIALLSMTSLLSLLRDGNLR